MTARWQDPDPLYVESESHPLDHLPDWQSALVCSRCFAASRTLPSTRVEDPDRRWLWLVALVLVALIWRKRP